MCLMYQSYTKSVIQFFSWGDRFTSQSWRTDRCCYIQAYWVKSGREIDKSNSSSRFGIIQYFFQQKLQLQGSHQLVQMASVHWLQEVSAYKNYFGEPYEVWSRDLYDPFSPATFIPVNRIKNQVVVCTHAVNHENVYVISPFKRKKDLHLITSFHVDRML